MNVKSRLHIYPCSGPKTDAYIVGEPRALKHLAAQLNRAADSVLGLETVDMYSSDGHEYTVVIASDVEEEEWQTVPAPYERGSTPATIKVIKNYNEIKEILTKHD